MLPRRSSDLRGSMIHIVYCFTNKKTFLVRTTDKPRLFTVVVFFYHRFFNNTGERCVLVINQHIGKCDSLKILLLLFCLSFRLPLDPHVVDCLHIFHKFFFPTIDKPQIFMVFVLIYHRFCQQYRQTLILRHQQIQR